LPFVPSLPSSTLAAKLFILLYDYYYYYTVWKLSKRSTCWCSKYNYLVLICEVELNKMNDDSKVV
jgi:hypothetical protein